MPEEWYLFPLRGQTRGSDTGHPPSARGRDTKGTKTHCPTHTQCRRVGVWLSVSLQVSNTLLQGSHLTCFQGLLSQFAGFSEDKHLKRRAELSFSCDVSPCVASHHVRGPGQAGPSGPLAWGYVDMVVSETGHWWERGMKGG